MNPFKPLFALDPKVTFLNHGSFGACFTEVLSHQNELRLQIERQPVQYFRRENEQRLFEALDPLTEVLDAPRDQLAFVPNTTFGINSILQSAPLEAGAHVCFFTHEYNATANAIRFHASRRHWRVTCLPLPDAFGPDPKAHSPMEALSSKDLADQIMSEVPDDCRMLVFDAVTSPSAWVLPSQDLVAICHNRGILSVIDGAHAPGQIPFSLGLIKPSYFVGNCHKWLSTPKGTAVIYADKPLIKSLKPVVISHGHNSERESLSRFHEEFFWTGTFDPSAILAIPKTLACLKAHAGTIDQLIDQNHNALCRAKATIQDRLGLVCPWPNSMLGAMAAFDVTHIAEQLKNEPRISEFDGVVQSFLLSRHQIEIPEIPEPSGRILLRISMYLYNDPSDVDRLVEALKPYA